MPVRVLSIWHLVNTEGIIMSEFYAYDDDDNYDYDEPFDDDDKED